CARDVHGSGLYYW
nr:immunoglobulin heavy chain junction region [Macaca mulatta]